MNSLFGKLFNYREDICKSPLENYLIEIFAFVLQKDTGFQKAFIEYIGSKIKLPIRIQTQVGYLHGRPDIEITIGDKDAFILIECKVESNEGANQLTNYLKIVDESNYCDKILIYLTKYYEPKTVSHSVIKFIQIRWRDVLNLIPDNANLITIEFKRYLIDLGMETKEFNLNDLSALKNISEAIRKMDEVLDGVAPYFIKMFGGISNPASRRTRLIDSWYGSFVKIKLSNAFYYVEFGFMWHWEYDRLQYLGARIIIPNLKKSVNLEIFNTFSKDFNNWKIDNYKGWTVIGIYKRITDFMIPETDQINEMIKFLKENLEMINKVKIHNPHLNGKIDIIGEMSLIKTP